jgi:hypothetical protein
MKKTLAAIFLLLPGLTYAEQFTVRDSLAFLIRIFGGANLQAMDAWDLAFILCLILLLCALIFIPVIAFLSFLGIIFKNAFL